MFDYNTRAAWSIFRRTLQLHYKFRYCHKMLSVVCLSSIRRVHCDNTIWDVLGI